MATSTAKKNGASESPTGSKGVKGSLIFIHGMWGGGRQWADWAARLGEDGYETLAPTLPYHDVAPSDPPPAELGEQSLQDYADFIEAQAATLSETPIIVGHSMGGIIAQILLARGVGKAGILLAPAPPAGAPAMWALAMPSVSRTLFAKLFSAAIPKKPHRLSFKQAAYACLNNMSAEQKEAEHAQWVWESGRVLWELAFWYMDGRKAARVDPAKVTVPTLTIAAGRDRIVPERVVRSNAKRYRGRGGDYAVFESNAHMLICEDGWEEVADYCADWMSEKVIS